MFIFALISSNMEWRATAMCMSKLQIFTQRHSVHLLAWMPGLLDTRVGTLAVPFLWLFKLPSFSVRDGDGALRRRWLPCFVSKFVFQTCRTEPFYYASVKQFESKYNYHEIGVVAWTAKEIAERSERYTVDRTNVSSQCVKQMSLLNIPHLSCKVTVLQQNAVLVSDTVDYLHSRICTSA